MSALSAHGSVLADRIRTIGHLAILVRPQPKSKLVGPAHPRWFLPLRRLLLGLIALALLWIVAMPRTLYGLNTFTVVSGSSMEPTFHTGDLLVSRQAKNYKIGTVVTYKIPDPQYAKFRIVHRIVAKSADGTYEIKGDNQDHSDPWNVPADNIKGAMVLLIPRGGYILGYIRNPVGMALLFGIHITWSFWPKKTKIQVEESVTLTPKGSNHDPFLAELQKAGLLNTPGSASSSRNPAQSVQSLESTEGEWHIDLPVPLRPDSELSIDELLERWINADADAPIPERFLFALQHV